MLNFVNLSYFSNTKIVHQNISNALKIASRKYSKGNLVDLGCGFKPYYSLFESNIESYFGVDFNEAAEKHYGEDTKPDLVADICNTKLSDNSFDTLLSTQVMEHINNTESYLKECYRILKPSSFGIFTVPFSWECHAEPYDFYRFTKHGLKYQFERNGFEVIEIKPLEGAYATILQLTITSIYGSTIKQSIPVRIYRKLQRLLFVPILNILALKLDRYFYNEKLCLNYLVVVKKN